MQPRFAGTVAAVCATLGAATPGAPRALAAQAWNDARTRELVVRATERRAHQLADTGLVDYRALAHGYLTFLAQVGEGFPELPKIVKTDELALEVYWHAPNLSKQRIVGRRDTLLLPTDIAYHRDHLGIVQNDFPNVIRVGEGDEVRDVPHPLSALGLATYDYAISDSLQIALPDRTIDVYEVRTRPRDASRAAVVGAVYLDRSEGQVVRMAFSFTRAALIDQELEDVAIVLENALMEGRFWLPRRQEVEIRRTGRWLEFPARGIIRGRWEICCYRINQRLDPAVFAGPEIVQAPPAELRAYPWTGRLLDSLPPDVRMTTDADILKVQEEARRLVRAEALTRAHALTLAARGISDFARVNRVEGLALGGGATRRLGDGVVTAATLRYGLADQALKGRVAIGVERADGTGARVVAFRTYRDARDVAERSTVINSLAAQEFGSDDTEPYDSRGAGLVLDLGSAGGVRWSLEATYERQRSLRVHATPSAGRYEPTIPAWSLREPRLALSLTRPTAATLGGFDVRGGMEVRAARAVVDDAAVLGRRATFLRVAGSAEAERALGDDRLLGRATAAAAWGARVPPQDLVFLGGPVTGPGYAAHQFAGRSGASVHVELRHAIAFPSLVLGRYGSTGRRATLAPFAHAVWIDRSAPFVAPASGWYPSVGAGLLTLFDLVRVDVGRGLRGGRWTLNLDVSTDFWRVL